MLNQTSDELSALSGLWSALVTGRWRISSLAQGDDRVSVTLRRERLERPVSDRDAVVLRQFLLAQGNQPFSRKHRAQICATVIRACGLQCSPSRVPLVLRTRAW